MNNLIDRKSSIPLYLQLSDILLQEIERGTWAADQQIPTEPALSRRFDVARGTLRQALAKLETDGYLRRERGRGTFVNELAGRQGTAADRQLAFVVPYVRDSFATTILSGVERYATQHGWSVIFRHVENDPLYQRRLLQELMSGPLSGVILYPVESHSSEPLRRASQSGFPLVMIDRYVLGVHADYVVADNFGGALRAVQHLIALNHERIGFVSWRDDASSIAQRQTGYRQAMAEAGLVVDDATMTCEVPSYPDIAPDALYPFLTRSPRPTAVFAANDQIAVAVYRVARELGLRIPQDLALVGFGNLEFTSQLDVPLTTVSMPALDMGYMAARTLIQRAGNAALPIQRLILPTELVIRQSCGGA